jgi:hypothetical protein
MTTRIEDEVGKRRGRPAKKGLAAGLGMRLIERASELGAKPKGALWPSPRWRTDPVGFAHDVLGVKLWAKQIEMLEAIRDHKRVAISGGRKVGKDYTVGVAALWWYSGFEDARVIMTATRAKQVDDVLWRDIKKLLRGSGLCVECKMLTPEPPRPCPHSAILDGELGQLARTGLKSRDFREITGYTAREAEAIAGVSGNRLLYLLDEASGIPDELHTAIRGNLASGESREVMISNPTRTMGKFFDAFHESKRFYKTIYVSSEEGPNVVAGKEIVPGLASRDWLQEFGDEYGKDSAFYKIHVQGQFALSEDGKILSVHAITEAKKAWDETVGEGPLRLACDPAGESGRGDESTFAARRGKKVITLYARRGLSVDGHLNEIMNLVHEYRQSGEVPTVAVDCEGSVGAEIERRFRNHLRDVPETATHPFALAVIRSSQRAQRQPLVYDKIADELWGNLAAWFRDGGAIPEDAKLERELHAQEWHGQVTGRQKITPKDDIRKLLHRSPDRADVLTLVCWEPIDYEARAAGTYTPSEQRGPDVYEPPRVDPWEALKAFGQ